MKNRAVHPGNCWWVPPRIPQSTWERGSVPRMARILAARHANVVRAIDLFTLDVLRFDIRDNPEPMRKPVSV